ncbi:MAG: DUF1700 domain-containing protein [Clostridiales bacterium]|nr:DUF1700 domain-containing protein [Clostridiales bacterium]
MTKYEWEHELKKNIHRLPSDEIARVLDYYNEMFEDYIERGKSEREIIREFGNPADVADKILSEYDGELLPEDGHISTPFDEPTATKKQSEPKKPSEPIKQVYDGIFEGYDDNKPDEFIEVKNVKTKPKRESAIEPSEYDKLSESDKRNLKVAIFLIINVVTGFGLVIAAVALWIVLAAFVISGIGIGIGGVYSVVVACGPLFSGAAGSGLAQLGIGIALIGLGIVITMLCVKGIRLYAVLTQKLFKSIFKVNKKESA